jgi:hypothetical protein
MAYQSTFFFLRIILSEQGLLHHLFGVVSLLSMPSLLLVFLTPLLIQTLVYPKLLF